MSVSFTDRSKESGGRRPVILVTNSQSGPRRLALDKIWMQLVSLTIRPKKSHSPRAVANSLRSALAVERRTVLRRFREANNVTAIVFHWLNDWSVGHLNFWLILNTSLKT